MISTGIKKLDQILDGGIKNGIITDIFGARGTGKTHLAMQISINSLQNGGTVLFLDTTGEFRPERMLEIIKTRHLEPSLLENVKVGRVTNTGEQIQYLSKIKEMDNFSLIIIDNITDLFSFEYSKELQVLEKNILFMRYMHDLSLIAIQKRIPIIITNMIRKIDKTEKENLYNSISLFTHLKINLIKKDAKYFGEIMPSFQEKRLFSYLITEEGLVDAS
ncbi:MAG: ATPase domain-containing protein [Nitrosopumilaceae archaeon]